MTCTPDLFTTRLEETIAFYTKVLPFGQLGASQASLVTGIDRGPIAFRKLFQTPIEASQLLVERVAGLLLQHANTIVDLNEDLLVQALNEIALSPLREQDVSGDTSRPRSEGALGIEVSHTLPSNNDGVLKDLVCESRVSCAGCQVEVECVRGLADKSLKQDSFSLCCHFLLLTFDVPGMAAKAVGPNVISSI